MAEEGPLANQTADFKMCLLKNGHLPLVGQILRCVQRPPYKRRLMCCNVSELTKVPKCLKDNEMEETNFLK